jgi:hypothetical protein
MVNFAIPEDIEKSLNVGLFGIRNVSGRIGSTVSISIPK